MIHGREAALDKARMVLRATNLLKPLGKRESRSDGTMWTSCPSECAHCNSISDKVMLICSNKTRARECDAHCIASRYLHQIGQLEGVGLITEWAWLVYSAGGCDNKARKL